MEKQMNTIQQWYEKIRTFFKEVKIELKKVTWPNREAIKTYTIVVLIVVFVISLYIGVIDKVFGKCLESFLKI
jgi:preprotein translocase subunit SecE